MSTEPWVCPKCGAVVFIPSEARVSGGVCTQKDRRGSGRGCTGSIERMSPEAGAAIREVIRSRGIGEQAWLTLVFSGPPVAQLVPAASKAN